MLTSWEVWEPRVSNLWVRKWGVASQDCVTQWENQCNSWKMEQTAVLVHTIYNPMWVEAVVFSFIHLRWDISCSKTTYMYIYSRHKCTITSRVSGLDYIRNRRMEVGFLFQINGDVLLHKLEKKGLKESKTRRSGFRFLRRTRVLHDFREKTIKSLGILREHYFSCRNWE